METIEMDGFKFGEKAQHKLTGVVGIVTALLFSQNGYNSIKIEWLRTDGGISNDWFMPNELERIGYETKK